MNREGKIIHNLLKLTLIMLVIALVSLIFFDGFAAKVIYVIATIFEIIIVLLIGRKFIREIIEERRR